MKKFVMQFILIGGLIFAAGFMSFTKNQLIRNAGATGIGMGTSCPMCGIGSNMINMPAPYMPTPYYGPWWSPYGAMAYSNFYYPAPWSSYGVNGSYYPMQSGCTGYVGKPNIYATGPAGMAFKMKLDFPSPGGLLAAIPSHGAEGWEGKLSKDGKFEVDGVKYPYMFYDFGLDIDEFQHENGFCAMREDLMLKLVTVMKDYGFKPNEIKDFQEYWSVKMPPAEKYCVYPQETSELDKVAVIQVSPQPEKITRLTFFVVTDDGTKLGKHDFKGEPKKSMRLPASSVNADAKKGPVQAGFEIREWGVGFLRGDR